MLLGPFIDSFVRSFIHSIDAIERKIAFFLPGSLTLSLSLAFFWLINIFYEASLAHLNKSLSQNGIIKFDTMPFLVLSPACLLICPRSTSSRTRHTHPSNQRTSQPTNGIYMDVSLRTSFGVKSNVSFCRGSLPLAYHLTRFTHFIAWFCGNGTFDFESRFFLSFGQFFLWIVYSFFKGLNGGKRAFRGYHAILVTPFLQLK